MIHQTINLSSDERVYMKTYFLDYSLQPYYKKGKWQPDNRPVFLILPGGGYGFQSDREAEPIAMAFTAQGIHCAVLYYSVLDHSRMPEPLEDVSKAVWYLRSHAEEFRIDPNAIVVGGFSAGGSLATILGTQWNTSDLAKRLNIPEGGNQPNALMVAYAPVDCRHMEIPDLEHYKEPLGEVILEKAPELNTAEKVGNHTPPTFIWHTSHDEIVNARNCLLFAKACLDAGVECELHMFQEGLHGRALGNDVTDYKADHDVNVAYWVPMFCNWMRHVFDF